jgi:NhaA family Na+:H+ antiporter
VDAAIPSPITHGIVVGLVVGKLVGISTFAWIATRLHVATLPEGTRFAQIVGVAALGGIGFTVSLFVSELAFGTAGALADDAKIGILAASITAAGLGAVLSP